MGKRTRAISYARRNEGGLADHPEDPGGITNHGISLRHAIAVGDIDGDGFDDFDFNLDGVVDATDIRMMSWPQAKEYYHHLYGEWRIEEIDEPAIAIKAFDLSFPVGHRQASLIVQRALRACGRPVLEDGIMGSMTISMINEVRVPSNLFIAISSEAAGFFRSLKSKSFENGWLKRAYSLPLMEGYYRD